jgi:hypothetical protein
MSGPAPLPWFTFSLTLAPSLVRERLPGVALPSWPEGEVVEALDVEPRYDVEAPDWGGRVARLVNAPSQRVTGRLRLLPATGWAQVAEWEARLAGATLERPVRVRTVSGSVISARTFTPPTPGQPAQGPVSEAFVVALARAAEHAKLPADVVKRLRAEAQLVHAVQRAQAERVR